MQMRRKPVKAANRRMQQALPLTYFIGYRR